MKLTEYEMSIASQLVDPAEISVKFEDVAGQGELVTELRQAVIIPLQKRHLFAGSDLMTAPKGVLLHGPPGCGKTLLARAVASESESAFFNISASTLTSKFVGEGEKLVRALFTAARQVDSFPHFFIVYVSSFPHHLVLLQWDG